MKKLKKIISITILLTILASLIPINSANAVENSSKTPKSTFCDFGDVDYLNNKYSYGSLFWTEGTEILDLGTSLKNKAGEELSAEDIQTQIANKELYAFKGDVIKLQVTKCAIDEDGDLCDVVMLVDNIVDYRDEDPYYQEQRANETYNEEREYLSLFKLSDTYEVTIDNTNNSRFYQTNLIRLDLRNIAASSDFTMTYYKTATSEISNLEQKANIQGVVSTIYDIDIENPDESKTGWDFKREKDAENNETGRYFAEYTAEEVEGKNRLYNGSFFEGDEGVVGLYNTTYYYYKDEKDSTDPVGPYLKQRDAYENKKGLSGLSLPNGDPTVRRDAGLLKGRLITSYFKNKDGSANAEGIQILRNWHWLADNENETDEYNKYKIEYGTQGICKYTTCMLMQDEGPTYSMRYGGIRCGIGYVFVPLIPFDPPGPVKSADVEQTTTGQTFHYTISQYIPNNYYASTVNTDIRNSKYKSVVLTDEFDSNLEIKETDIDKVKVVNIEGKDFSKYWTIKVEGNKLTATATKEALESAEFYNQTSKFIVPMIVKEGCNLSVIPNNAKTTFNINGLDIERTSNKVEIKVGYTVTIDTKVINGVKDQNEAVTVEPGKDNTFTVYIKPNNGFELKSLTVDGKEIDISTIKFEEDGSYTFKITDERINKNIDHIVRAVCEEVLPAEHPKTGVSQCILFAIAGVIIVAIVTRRKQEIK